MTASENDLIRENDVQRDPRSWWRRIQWIDVVLVILGVIVLLMLTFELWLPHHPFGVE
jgi:hypothetical protein